MIKWEGYAPDADDAIPGIFTDCTNVIPTLKGYAGAPSPQTGTLAAALAAAPQGAALVRKLDNSVRLFAGSGTKLYEAGSSSWTDRTRVSGGDYALGSDIRWRFTQYGDVSLAVAKTDNLQASTTAAFSTVSGAPKASIVETVGNFVFLFDTNEGTYSDSPNRWWCSALGDYTDWTPDVATQCATGILSSTNGKILAGKRFGEGVVAYKERAMYIGVYVGPPAIWEFREIPGETGGLSQEAIVNVGTAEDPRHIFMGSDDFYSFDGARPVPLGDGRIKETVFTEINQTYKYLSAALHDRVRSIIYFFYPSTDSVTLDKCVVYNYKTNRWGRFSTDIIVPVDFSAAATTYADVGTLYGNYEDMPNIPYGSPFWSANTVSPGVFNTSSVLQSLTGASVTSSITTGDIGDDDIYSTLHRVKIRYQNNGAPTTAQMTNYYKNDSGAAPTTDTTTTESTLQENRRFDVLRSARWHRFAFNFTGNWEASGMRLGLKPDGNE